MDNKQQAFENISIAALRESYIEVVVPKNASDIQLLETRHAFMAGAKSMFDLLEVVSKNHNEDIAEQMFSNLYDELEAYGVYVMKLVHR